MRIFFGRVKGQGTDPRQQFTVNSQVSFQHFNLSRSKSLRTLETTVRSIICAGDAAPSSLRTVLSTVTSPMFLDVTVIVYHDDDLDRWAPDYYGPPRVGRTCFFVPLPEEIAAYTLRHQQTFKVFREMHEASKFRLVLCADVSDPVVEYTVEMLERFVKAERMEGGLDYLPCEPLIISEVRAPRTRPQDNRTGISMGNGVLANAL